MLKKMFILDYGSLIGWFRQCDIITYSQDIDFGIWIKDYKPDLVPVFERGGFLLTHVFGKVNIILYTNARKST